MTLFRCQLGLACKRILIPIGCQSPEPDTCWMCYKAKKTLPIRRFLAIRKARFLFKCMPLWIRWTH